ncbi:hypothetical protein D9756_010058 [Leucocoprinus leucothites]|uniref:Uncharacterized protein n=1 Tax=Leucocoprinus leucothites TaxID=201217 RepID=A0A8H5CRI1_9AGAR|nr:hypothetical protein D9756_010058 [Leucoagaricus leucothites]
MSCIQRIKGLAENETFPRVVFAPPLALINNHITAMKSFFAVVASVAFLAVVSAAPGYEPEPYHPPHPIPTACLKICYAEKPGPYVCGEGSHAQKFGDCWTCCKNPTYHHASYN